MTTEPVPLVSLLDAARILARGGSLDAKLRGLAGHAGSLPSAVSAIVLLHNPDTGHLFPPDGSDPLDPATREDGLAIAVRDRRTATTPAAGGRPELARLVPAETHTIVPVVLEDETGAELEGVLVVGFSGTGAPTEAGLDALGALADLAAVAIRQARLENALVEQADYQQRLAHTDGLTGLANRRTFEQMLELELARAVRSGAAVCVCLFGVDDIDGIRIAHGAGAADNVLRHIAATLAGQVRLIDTVARIRDGEFGVIAPGEGGRILAERVRDAVAAHQTIPGIDVGLTAGVARVPDDGATSPDLMDAAGTALRVARERGSGSVVEARELPTGN